LSNRFQFKAVGASAQEALQKFLHDREVMKQQQFLNSLLVEDRARQQHQAEAAAQRQAAQDTVSAEDRARRVANEDRAYADQQERTRIADERYASEQQQKASAAADAVANRYLDSERQYAENERKRQYDAAEAARDRASQERRARQDAGAKPTQGQLTADTFYGRATDALNEVEAVEDSVSSFNRYIPNFLQSEAGQSYEQSKRQFIEAYLRKDSGAAIGKDEYANADRTYFVQPGDSAATVKRKREARRKLAETIKTQGTNANNSGTNTGSVVRWGRDANGRPVRQR
jgi:hypothetical protein